MILNPVEIRRLICFATKRTGAPCFDEDLAQETMLRALAAFRRTSRVDNPRAFLMKIVLDTVRDHWRRRRMIEDIELVEERFIAEPANFETAIDERRRSEVLHRALAALEPRKRDTVAMFYLEGMSVSEIARRQEKSASAVKMELMRARQQLGRIIGEIAHKKSQ